MNELQKAVKEYLKAVDAPVEDNNNRKVLEKRLRELVYPKKTIVLSRNDWTTLLTVLRYGLIKADQSKLPTDLKALVGSEEFENPDKVTMVFE